MAFLSTNCFLSYVSPMVTCFWVMLYIFGSCKQLMLCKIYNSGHMSDTEEREIIYTISKGEGGNRVQLAMLGVGNGFSPGIYDNNAVIRHRDGLSLIDCGTTAWVSMDQMKLSREDVREIFLTHLHFDHSGGVESAALYSQYMWGRRYRLIVPKPIKARLWDHVLKGTIENSKDRLTTLEDYFDVVSPEEGEVFDFCGTRARWIQTRHVDEKFSCGILMGARFFYTSDMRCNRELLEQLHSDGVELIFHDCQLTGKVVTHGDFKELCSYPDALRRKLYLMHHGLSEASDLPDSKGMHFLFQQQWMDLRV